MSVNSDRMRRGFLRSYPATPTSKKAKRKVKTVLHEFKQGQLHSGRGGPVVKSRKQAIAIALSEGRRHG